MDLTKVPLVFAKGATLKKAARWNQQQILDAGTLITPEIIGEYADVAMYIPTSLRVENSTSDLEHLIELNIRNWKERKKNEKMQDLSESFTQGETIFSEGTTSDRDCFLLTQGSVDVYREGHLLVTLDETGIPLGEMSFLSGAPRSATLIAAENSKLLRLKYTERKSLMRSNPTIVQTLLETLVKRLNDTSGKLVEQQKHTAEAEQKLEAEKEQTAKLAAEISTLSDGEGLPGKFKALASYVEQEVAVKIGNVEVGEELLAKLQTEYGERLASGMGAGLYDAITVYIEYMRNQPRSRAIDPEVKQELMPYNLKKLLGYFDE